MKVCSTVAYYLTEDLAYTYCLVVKSMSVSLRKMCSVSARSMALSLIQLYQKRACLMTVYRKRSD